MKSKLRLKKIISALNTLGFKKDAMRITRIAQSRPWWQNDAGEPMYSPEAIRAEEEFDIRDYPDDDRDYYPEDNVDQEAREQSEQFQEVYDNWASHQPNMEKVQLVILQR